MPSGIELAANCPQPEHSSFGGSYSLLPARDHPVSFEFGSRDVTPCLYGNKAER